MAPRTAWKGAIAFGLVPVPVKLHARSTDRKGPAVHQVTDDGTRVRQLKVKEGTKDEVPFGDIRKGVEIASGHTVVLDDAAFDDTRPENDKQITIEGVIPAREAQALITDGTAKRYWMSADTGGAKAYALLASRLRARKEALAVRLTFGTRESLAVLTTANGLLYLTTLLWHEDLREPGEEDRPAAEKVSAEEASLADLLLSQLPQGFDWAAARDESRRKLEELVEASLARKAGEAPPPEPKVEPTELMAALVASVQAHKPKVKAGGKQKAA